MRDFSLGRAGVLLSGSLAGLIACVVMLRIMAPQMYLDAIRFFRSIVDSFINGIARMSG